ncbi:MAG: sigma-70 family RNA polymerase sigma factor [Planctomycetota bacterium]|nr:MAG: sigma-70 family RNA polymerase sigma factor [Planctomycetota bacterium]
MSESLPPLQVEELLAESGWLRRLALRLVGDGGEADDLVQETWMRALERPPRDQRSPRGWLGQVARSLAVERWRGSAAQRRREQAAASQPSAAAPEPPVDVAGTLELHQLLVAAVRELEEPYRSAVVMRYYAGLEPVEIARRAGVPDSTVRNRLSRGLALLRRRLEGRYGREWKASCLAVLLPQAGSIMAPALGTGAVAMSVTGKLGLASAAVLAAALFVWVATRDSGTGAGDEQTQASAAAAPRDAGGGAADAVGVVEGAGGSRTSAPGGGEAARDWSVRVSDTTGQPIAGAEVEVYSAGLWTQESLIGPRDRQMAGERLQARGRTAEDGRFAAAPGTAPLAVYARAPGYVERALHVPEAAEGVDVTLYPGSCLALQFLDPEGKPVPGVLVEVMGVADRNPGTQVQQSARSDADGLCSLSSLPARVLQLRATAAGFLFYYEPDPDTTPAPAGPRRVVLDRGGAIDVLVREADGMPAAGAEIFVLPFRAPLKSSALSRSDMFFCGLTGGDGRLRVTGVPPQGVASVVARRGASWAQEDRAPGTSLELVLPATWSVRGRLLRPEGTPAAGATAALVELSQPVSPPDFRVQVGEDGRFAATLRQSRYGFAAVDAGGTLIREEALELSQDVDLGDVVLPSGPQLELQVLDAASEEPVAGAQAMPRPAQPRAWMQSEPEDWKRVLLGLASACATPSGEDGWIRARYLPEGRQELVVFAPGYESVLWRGELASGQRTQDVVRLGETFEVLVQALDASGAARAGVGLQLIPDGYDLVRALSDDSGQSPVQAVTDAEGWARFPGCRAGRWNLGDINSHISKKHYQSLDVGPGRTEFRVTLPASAGARFSVLGSSGPLPGVELRIKHLGGAANPFDPGLAVQTDASGQYSAESLDAGAYRVTALPPARMPVVEEFDIPPGWSEHVLRISGFRVSGRVHGAVAETYVVLARVEGGSEALALLESIFWSAPPPMMVPATDHFRFAHTLAQGDGSFAFDDCPPGTYFLLARAPDHAVTTPLELQVEAAPVSGLELALEPAGRIELRVHGVAELKQRHPQAVLYAMARDAGGNAGGQAYSELKADETVALTPVRPGEVVVEFLIREGQKAVASRQLRAAATAGGVTLLDLDLREFLP